MNKVFEKILEMLEEIKGDSCDDRSCSECEYKPDCFEGEMAEVVAIDKAKEIVQEVAEEYNGGWIPCSERLPDDDSICIVTVEYPNNETVVDYGWFDRIGVCWYVGMQEFRTSNIIAWQPLPEPYKEREYND